MSHEEHLEWAKGRARPYLERGQFQEAFTSMVSDLEKHEDWKDHPFFLLSFQLLLNGHLSSYKQIRDWIEGWN